MDGAALGSKPTGIMFNLPIYERERERERESRGRLICYYFPNFCRFYLAQLIKCLFIEEIWGSNSAYTKKPIGVLI